jgi:alpha-galactosidase
MISARTSGESVTWADDAMDLQVDVGDDGVARLALLAPAQVDTRLEADIASERPVHRAAAGLPVLDVLLAGSGRQWTGQRYSESVVGSRMRYVSHDVREDGPWSLLEIALLDPVTELTATVALQT